MSSYSRATACVHETAIFIPPSIPVVRMPKYWTTRARDTWKVKVHLSQHVIPCFDLSFEGVLRSFSGYLEYLYFGNEGHDILAIVY